MIFDERWERLWPGEGGITLVELFACLPLSVEVPGESRAPKKGYRAWAQQAMAGARAELGGEGLGLIA